MRNHMQISVLVLVLVSSLLYSEPASQKSLVVLPSVRITVLVDNMAGPGPVVAEWGAAFVIQTPEHQVLFDTGAGRVLAGNARALNLDWKKTEAIVLSHEHFDHTGGLQTALDASGPLEIFLHPSAFDTRYFRQGAQAIAHRLPFSREQLGQRVRKVIETREPATVREGLMVTGQVPRVTEFEDTGLRAMAFLDQEMTQSDPINDDQALFFEVPEGLVMVTGCAHSGLVNIMKYVTQLTGKQKIYAVIGGTHLVGASPARLQRTVAALREYDVQKIMLSHCTGIQAYSALDAAFPGRCSWPGVGTVIRFGSN